jgi:predicted metal-dependent hydrolase
LRQRTKALFVEIVFHETAHLKPETLKPETPIEADPRFLRGISLFNAGDFLEACDEFEELFVEAVRDEVEFVRVFLQLSVGIHHVERGQCRAAIQRLEEGINTARRVASARGVDLQRLIADVEQILPRIQARAAGAKDRIIWPAIHVAGR